MCGRYTLERPTAEIAQRFDVQTVMFEAPPRYNIAPSQYVPVVTQNGTRQLDGYKWGLIPSWAKDPAIGNRMINARAETLLEKPSFRSALLRRRCLVPADGFYEWQRSGTSKKRTKQPLYIHRPDGELFAFAGLWDEWMSPDGSPLRSCTIITTTANEFMAPIHDRMPVILRPDDEDRWLETSDDDARGLMHLLKPCPDDYLEAYAVSPRLNTPAYDSPDCIEPLVEE